jgi:hypothetical protein
MMPKEEHASQYMLLAEKILKYEYLTIEMQRMWNVKEKVIPGITGRLEMVQTVPEQQSGEVRNQGITETSHTVHCTESADVKAQNILYGRNNMTCSTDCKYRTGIKLCTVQTRFVSGI